MKKYYPVVGKEKIYSMITYLSPVVLVGITLKKHCKLLFLFLRTNEL
jgi:hypothetical protein